MAYTKPTFKELIKSIESDFFARFNNDTRPSLISIIKVLSRVLAGIAYPLYCFIEWTIRQMFPDKAEENYFAKWASLYNVQRKKADYAIGTAIFSGENNSVIPQFTKIQNDVGVIFQTTKEAKILNNKIEVEIFAVKVGTQGNLKPNTILSLISPLNGVNIKAVTGINGTYNGTDLEDLESWRQRFLLRLRNPPCAGNKTDYENWALEVTGVTRAWCYPNFPEQGSVGLTFVRDNDDINIPNPDQLNLAREYIKTKMPITANLNLFSLTPLVINFEIQLKNNIEDNQNKVIQGLKSLIVEYGAPNNTIKFYQFIQYIQLKNISLNDFNIVSPKEDITAKNKEIHRLGKIIFKDMN